MEEAARLLYPQKEEVAFPNDNIRMMAIFPKRKGFHANVFVSVE